MFNKDKQVLHNNKGIRHLHLHSRIIGIFNTRHTNLLRSSLTLLHSRRHKRYLSTNHTNRVLIHISISLTRSSIKILLAHNLRHKTRHTTQTTPNNPRVRRRRIIINSNLLRILHVRLGNYRSHFLPHYRNSIPVHYHPPTSRRRSAGCTSKQVQASTSYIFHSSQHVRRSLSGSAHYHRTD